MKSTALILACCLAASVHAGELYRSIDAQGKVHYSDRPPPGTDDVEQLHPGQPPAPDATLPYETRHPRTAVHPASWRVNFYNNAASPSAKNN